MFVFCWLRRTEAEKMFSVRAVALAFAILSPAQADWIAWMTQDPVRFAEAYVAELLPAFKSLDVTTLERLYTTHCVFGNPDTSQPPEQKDSLVVGMTSVGLDHESKIIVGMKIISAVAVSKADWESDVTGAKHAIQVTAWVKVEVEGQSDFYQWVTLVPFEGAENGWSCNMVLMSPAPVSDSTEFLAQPVKEVADASVSVPAVPAPRVLASRDDAVKIAEAYVADWLPAFKKLDVAKLEGMYSADCVFGNPDAGKSAQQKDVLMKGMKSAGVDQASKAFGDEVKAMNILSAVTGIVDAGVPVRVTALVKVEMEKGDDFYSWSVLVPSGSWHGDVWKSTGWVSAAVLAAPTPVSPTAELLEQPVQAVSDASVSVAALPASLVLLATFASGVLVSGCFFGRKEVFARLTAPSALREPLL
jgi:ketosteroid isomerase-like protein